MRAMNTIEQCAYVDPAVRKAIDAIDSDRVQEIIKELSDYGLGVCVPHMHDDKGRFLPLPFGTVQSERGCKVTFVKEDELGKDAFAVAWRWDERKQAVAFCNGCGPSNGGCQ